MTVTRDALVDAALRRADQMSWEALRLHDVAGDLSISLEDVRKHFREKEEIVDAWFDRADSAMLQQGAAPDPTVLETEERLERALMAWFGALAPFRRVTRQMIMNKLEPGHLHYQWSGAMRVSRTVQWWREAAHRSTVLPWRALEETALTGIYLATFSYWMYDDSFGASRTQKFLRRRLKQAARLARAIPGFSRRRRSYL